MSATGWESDNFEKQGPYQFRLNGVIDTFASGDCEDGLNMARELMNDVSQSRGIAIKTCTFLISATTDLDEAKRCMFLVSMSSQA
jgi:hypothetical protein